METANAVIPQVDAQKAANILESKDFVAYLLGFEQVPQIYTQAQALANFSFSLDGTALRYKLIGAYINDIMQAHIHLAPKGQNGQEIVWLYPSAPPPTKIPGRFDGIVGEGTILASSMMGPLAGQPLSVLADNMTAGTVYVDIHTERSPNGEIRGQINIRDVNSPVANLTTEVTGTVTSIAGNNISVQTENRMITFIKNNRTIVDTGDVGPSGQLAVGSAIQVYFDPETFIADKIELERPEDLVSPLGTTRVEGTIVSVSGIYIRVKTANGAQVLVENVTGTVLEYEDGTPANRVDIKPGVVIEATVRISSRWATRIEIKR